MSKTLPKMLLSSTSKTDHAEQTDMTAAQLEGVIKFALDYQAGPPPDRRLLVALNGWRTIFVRLGLVGQDSGRYAGLGFGNLSRRHPELAGNAFIISGTQTGGLNTLSPEHYVLVSDCNPRTNRVRATGPVRPSSEALSHGTLYQAVPDAHWVMHLHSPDIYAVRDRLRLPSTAPDAAYGTPDMAEEIARLAKTLDSSRPQLIVMGGHEDGVLVYGNQADQVGHLAVQTLVEALAIK
ncbi:MAG: class II aldolase/adducin family protein [Deltaproteobacteria bacterium]|nr:class II aldolase/adducin family protein [Deltaproteobacteria bacterium]